MVEKKIAVEPDAQLDFTILNDVHEEEEEQSPVMKEKENSLSDSEVRNEILMFNQAPDHENVDIQAFAGISLLNERPTLIEDPQILSKKKR